jgi:hypothetical protein
VNANIASVDWLNPLQKKRASGEASPEVLGGLQENVSFHAGYEQERLSSARQVLIPVERPKDRDQKERRI